MYNTYIYNTYTYIYIYIHTYTLASIGHAMDDLDGPTAS